MKDTLRITCEYLYDTELDLEVRAAALYTLYGLYYHQMNRPRTKVNKKWHEWLEFEYYSNRKILDTSYARAVDRNLAVRGCD